MCFDPGSDFEHLGFGEIATTSVTYTIEDSQGASSSATVTVTVSGANSLPTAQGTIGPQFGVDSTTIAALDVSSFFVDADTNDSLTFSDGGSLPPGLAIDPLTGQVSGTFDTNASTSSPYSVTIAATDSQGASTSQSFCLDSHQPCTQCD